jgi:hypothetical protein
MIDHFRTITAVMAEEGLVVARHYNRVQAKDSGFT